MVLSYLNWVWNRNFDSDCFCNFNDFCRDFIQMNRLRNKSRLQLMVIRLVVRREVRCTCHSQKQKTTVKQLKRYEVLHLGIQIRTIKIQIWNSSLNLQLCAKWEVKWKSHVLTMVIIFFFFSEVRLTDFTIEGRSKWTDKCRPASRLYRKTFTVVFKESAFLLTCHHVRQFRSFLKSTKMIIDLRHVNGHFRNRQSDCFIIEFFHLKSVTGIQVRKSKFPVKTHSPFIFIFLFAILHLISMW